MDCTPPARPFGSGFADQRPGMTRRKRVMGLLDIVSTELAITLSPMRRVSPLFSTAALR